MNSSAGVDPEDEPHPTAEQIWAWRKDDFLIPPTEVDPDLYPRLRNMSTRFHMKAIVRPQQPAPLEYATIDLRDSSLSSDERTREMLAVHQWNAVWESAQFRRRYFDEDELSGQLGLIADLGDVNIYLVPRTQSRYYEYAPLLHMLPRTTLEKFGLPTLRGGSWPFSVHEMSPDDFLPVDFEQRLTKAWAWTVWPHIDSGSRMSAFGEHEPLKLLAHNLDFWVPPSTSVIQQTLRTFPEITTDAELGPVPLSDGSYLEGAVMAYPRMGGDVWTGEIEARNAVDATVEAADTTGKLRGIIDAIRSNRVQDDFSSRWSYAREDFERKLYSKRSKVKVRFVELTDTIPVQGPESDVIGNLVTNDFVATLDARNREIVVLLNSGVNTHTEVAELLGYANHSAVSKRLATIRQQAAIFFDL